MVSILVMFILYWLKCQNYLDWKYNEKNSDEKSTSIVISWYRHMMQSSLSYGKHVEQFKNFDDDKMWLGQTKMISKMSNTEEYCQCFRKLRCLWLRSILVVTYITMSNFGRGKFLIIDNFVKPNFRLKLMLLIMDISS